MPDNKEDKIPEEFKKEDNGIYSKEDREKARDDVKSLLSKLEDGLKAVFDSDNYKNYLNTMSKFHNYSINNTLLINQQMPEATLVAGFNAWANNFDRHVKKGEKGIKITLLPGQECLWHSELIDALKRGEALTLNGTRYVLVEFMPSMYSSARISFDPLRIPSSRSV